MKIKLLLAAFITAALPLCCSTQAEDQAPASGAKAPEKSAESASGAKASEKKTEGTPSESTDKTEKAPMKRVRGIGGVFIKAKDPAKLRAWYKTHLGIDVQAWGGATFRWADSSDNPAKAKTAWRIGNGANFAPSAAPFMINYRVADLRGLVKALRDEGCEVLDKIEESEFGIFGWVMDPEGNKIELWQPPAGQ